MTIGVIIGKNYTRTSIPVTTSVQYAHY